VTTYEADAWAALGDRTRRTQAVRAGADSNDGWSLYLQRYAEVVAT